MPLEEELMYAIISSCEREIVQMYQQLGATLVPDFERMIYVRRLLEKQMNLLMEKLTK